MGVQGELVPPGRSREEPLREIEGSALESEPQRAGKTHPDTNKAQANTDKVYYFLLSSPDGRKNFVSQ